MNIPLNISIFIYIGIFLLGTFTCTIYILKALIEKQELFKIGSVLISAFLLYSCFEFLICCFADNPQTWLFHICIALSDAFYFFVVVFWLFLLGLLSHNQYLVKKKILIAITAVYGIAVEFLVYLELREDNLILKPESLDLVIINGFHLITLLNFAFSIFLIIWGIRCLLYGILKMHGEYSQKLMVVFSFIFIIYLIWIVHWDYSVTVWSEENLLKFDPILIVFFIVCLISLRMLYKNNFLFIDLNKKYPSGSVIDEDHMWVLLEKKYQLTQREAEIIKLVYKGKSNPDIGKKLFIAEDTVKKHLNHIFRKTGTQNRYELMTCITKEISAITK